MQREVKSRSIEKVPTIIVASFKATDISERYRIGIVTVELSL